MVCWAGYNQNIANKYTSVDAYVCRTHLAQVTVTSPWIQPSWQLKLSSHRGLSLFSFHFTIKLESVSFEEICKHNNSLESGHQHRVNRDSDATSCNDLTNTHSYILINITRLISSTRAIEFPERRSIHSFHKLAPIPKAGCRWQRCSSD